MSFLYFVEHAHPRPKIEFVRELGLGYAFEGAVLASQTTGGPDGRNGFVIGDQPRWEQQQQRLKYSARNQTWMRLPDVQDCKAFVGYWDDSPPAPQQLLRASPIDGPHVMLGDGRLWQIPQARVWFEQDGEDTLYFDCRLDRRRAYEGNGIWTPGDVVPRQRRLWEMSLRYQAAYEHATLQPTADGDQAEFADYTQADADAFAIESLQLNYVVGPTELSMLGVYDEEARKKIFAAVLDHETYLQLVKKKLALKLSGGCGQNPHEPGDSSPSPSA